MAVNNSNDRTGNSAIPSPAEECSESPRQPSIKTSSLQAAHGPFSQASRSRAEQESPPRSEADVTTGSSPYFDQDNSSNAIAIGRQTSETLELGKKRVGRLGSKREYGPTYDTTAAKRTRKQGFLILEPDISSPRDGDLPDQGELDLDDRQEAHNLRSSETNPGTASRNGTRTGVSMSSDACVAEHDEERLDALKEFLGTITHSSATVNDQDWSNPNRIDVVFRYIAIATRMRGVFYVDHTLATTPDAPLPSIVVERIKPPGLETRTILFPLRFQDHSWALAKLTVASRVIQLYDPMPCSDRFEVAEDTLRCFLSRQEFGRWEIESFEEDRDFTQRCTDVRDCGLLIITAAMYHATVTPSSRKVKLDIIRSICQGLVGVGLPTHLGSLLSATTLAASPTVALTASTSDAPSVRGFETRLCGEIKELRILLERAERRLFGCIENFENANELAMIMMILSEGAIELADHMEALENGLTIRNEIVCLLSELQEPSAVSTDILVSEQRVIEDDLDNLQKVMGVGAREVVSTTVARQAGEHMQKVASSLRYVADELEKKLRASTSLGLALTEL